MALQVGSLQDLEQIKERLLEANIEVLGIIDHHIFKSIYFFDPNGIRLELSAQLASDEQMQQAASQVHEKLAQWNVRKIQWRMEAQTKLQP